MERNASSQLSSQYRREAQELCTTNISNLRKLFERPRPAKPTTNEPENKGVMTNNQAIPDKQAESASSNRSLIQDFISKAIATMDHEYKNWSNTSTSYPTICIPPYFETVRKNLESESLTDEDKKGNRGDVSEQKVFDALKKLNKGVMIVANVDSKDIAKNAGVLWKEFRKLFTVASGFKDGDKHDFQCDFMLFHQKAGIVIIEVKSTEGNDNTLPKDATEKFTKTVKKLKLLIKAITGKDDCEIPVKSLFCCPNLKLTANYRINNPEIAKNIIDGNILSTGQKLVEFWEKIVDDSYTSNFFDNAHFQSIAAFFCCYRRAIYLNEVLNAVEVAKLVDQQNLRPQLKAASKGKKNCNIKGLQTENHSNVIFFTDEQKSIVDSNEQCQLVFGPPGTGKTLVFIEKLLKSMQEKSTNRLIVFTFAQYLGFRKKLEKIISVASTPNRSPIFIGNLNDVDSNDDFYCDECGNEMIPFLLKRQRAAGTTFTIFTGTVYAGQYNQFKINFASLLANYKIHYLEKVIRGTQNIVEYWRKEMDISSNNFTVGHGIRGPTVPPPQFHTTFHETLTAIRDHIMWLINNGAQPNHISVINDQEQHTKIIALFLKNNGISTISSHPLKTDQNAIIVEWYQNVYSNEWPFVIVCSLTCIDNEDSFLLLASSRAIAYLIIISFDHYSMQRYVEHQLKIQLKRKFSGWLEFFECTERAVNNYSKELNMKFAYDEDLIKFCVGSQFPITALRLNIVATPFEKRPPMFQECQRLTDCLKIIVQNQNWMQRFVEKYYDILKIEKERQLNVIRDFFADTEDQVKITARQHQPSYLKALQIDAPSEDFVVFGDFRKKFAAEATLYFRRIIISSEMTHAEKNKPTEMRETDGSELLEEIVFVMLSFFSCFVEILSA